MDGWTEAGSSNTPTWDEQTPIQGKFIKTKSGVGPNKSMLYTLLTKDGEVGIWGSTVLDTKFSEIPHGSEVRVEFLGKATGKNGRSQYKDYKVLYKAPVGQTQVEQVQDAFPGAEEVNGADEFDKALGNL